MRRRAVRVAATALVAGIAFATFAGPGQASAHSSLIGTTPKEDGKVSSPMANVKLRFNEDIQAKFATVAITDPDGTKVSAGKPDVDGTVVKQSVKAFRATGKYQVGWRVVSTDGHPVSGSFSFTVTKGAVRTNSSTTATSAETSASPTASQVASKQQPPDDRTFLERHAAHLLIGVVIVLAGVAVIVWERRRRHD